MLCSKFNLTRIHFEPLLFPFWSLNIVHSSIFPKGWNNCLTSSSVCCLLSMPTKSFRSSVRNKTKQFVQLHFFITFKIQQKKFIFKKCTDLRDNYTKSIAVVVFKSRADLALLLFSLSVWLRLKTFNKRRRGFSFNPERNLSD